MTLPKFIITMDGYFRLGMVNQHKDLLKPGDSCIGGGYYVFDFVSNRIILDRESYDFGRPKWHLLEVLKVPSTYRGLRIVYKYDDGFHLYEYNSLRPSQTQRMKEILKGLLGYVADDDFLINQPFRCDYGKQISIGKRFFANFNFTVLDEAPVTIGDDCFIGPNVSIYTACHSTDPVERNSRREWAEPVSIGNNVWIGGSVTILPGVTIGDNVTIGAGSVVTKDIPSNSIAVGNPCKVIKKLESVL